MSHRFDLRIRRLTAVLPLTLRGNHASLSAPASDSSRNGRLLHRHFTRAECRAPPTLAFLPAMCTRLRPEHNRQAAAALIRQPKRHDAALTSLRSVYNVNAVAPVAQWIEHFSPKEGVVGSIPIWGTFSYPRTLSARIAIGSIQDQSHVRNPDNTISPPPSSTGTMTLPLL